MDVTERKRAAEALLRGEAYLAEGQKLSHTGTWACNLATREMIHSSEEHRHLFGLVPERVGIPPFEEFYQRIHPDDQGPTVRDLERAMTAGTDIEAHFRVVWNRSPSRQTVRRNGRVCGHCDGRHRCKAGGTNASRERSIFGGSAEAQPYRQLGADLRHWRDEILFRRMLPGVGF